MRMAPLGSGSSGRKAVEVRVLFRALQFVTAPTLARLPAQSLLGT